jgi:hypothetical protein
LAQYVLGDHSPSVVAGSVLSGAYDGLSAAAGRPDAGLVSLIAFVVELVGLVFVLLLPRLRLLIVVAALLALVPWFFAGRGAMAPFMAQSGFWPALLVGAASVSFAAAEAGRQRRQPAPELPSHE